MEIKLAVQRLIERLMKLPFSFTSYLSLFVDGLSAEFNRVNSYRERVKTSTVPNDNMDVDSIEDYETKYGIENLSTSTTEERIARIIQRASRDGNGGPDWLEAQIQGEGFPLYVIINEPESESSVPQFGDFQFDDVQFGGLVSYIDPRDVDGELVASSPNGNIGGLFEQFGSLQFGPTQQFGTLIDGVAYPRPRPFVLPSDPDRWGYVFFLSPFSDRIAGSSELLDVTEEEWRFLNKLILQLKYTRNWCIAQVNIT